MTENERAKKFAMRQVKARLLKFNGLYGDGDSDDSDEVDKKMPPQPPS